jgi:hypothetical protein
MGGLSTPSLRRRRCAVKVWCLWSLVSTAAKPCPAVRKKRYLAFAATGGLGNQYYNLKTAVWVSRAADRTLVLPPILPHGRLSASYVDRPCTRRTAGTLVGDVQARADRAYAQVRGRGHASWRRVLDLSKFEATGLRFADAAASLSVAAIPFCGSMTRGWTAANITQRLPANPIILKLGRALGGSRGLDLEAVRPACDLRGCGREAARAAWSLHPALREATAYLRRNVKQSIVCAHVRTGRGETSTYLSFLDHAVAALVRHLRTRSDAPAVYLASDMSLGDIRRLRSQSKAVDELFELCDGGGERCAFVGNQGDARFGEDVVEWRRRARFARRIDKASERVILDVATCVLADAFVQSPARTSSLAVMVNDLRRNASTQPCGVHDYAPGPRRGVVGFGETRLAAAQVRASRRRHRAAGVGSDAYAVVT